MTYGQLRRAVLRLLNADTLAGESVPLSYNNQADLVLAIPGLADDAMMQIATTARRIPASAALEDLEKRREGGSDVYLLPSDCWRLRGRCPLRTAEGGRYTDGRAVGRRLAVPAGTEGLRLEYWRYPVSLGDAPRDGEELDNEPDTHAAIPYFVAAQLVLYDDPYRYVALHNEWEKRLARMSEPVVAERAEIGEVYGFFAAADGG